MAQEVSLVLKPKKAVFREVMNAQLPVHATGPCVILLLLSHFLLSQLPPQPLLLSMYASVHYPCIQHIVFLCD